MFDADATGRDHGLGVPGAVYGKLTAYAQGLGFAASKTEDALRERSTVVAIDAATITGFRVVPARAGADGVVRPKRPRQSRFPRLVVDTSNGSHVFELSHAADVAETLRQAFAGI